MGALSIGLGIGCCVAVQSGDIDVSALPDPLPELLPRPVGSVEIRVADGAVTVTVAGSGAYDGAFATTVQTLAAGPVPLLPPSAPSGATDIGDVLSARTALFVHAAGRAPAVARRWTRDGAAISGATGATYALTAADLGARIAVTETATNADGMRAATGAALAIPATPVITIDAAPSATAMATDLGILRAGETVAGILARLRLSSLGTATTSGPGSVTITPVLVARIDGPALTALAQGDTVSHVRLGYAATGAVSKVDHVPVGKVVQAAPVAPSGLVDFADASRPGFGKHGGVSIDAAGWITFATAGDRKIGQYCAPPLLAGAHYEMTLEVTGPAGDTIGVLVDEGIPNAEAVTVVKPIPAGAGPHAIVVAFRMPGALAADTKISLLRSAVSGPATVRRAVVEAVSAPAVAVDYMVSGAPARDGFTVSVKTGMAASNVAVAWSMRADMAAATLTPAKAAAAPSLVAKCRIDGAPAGQRIHYQARVDGVPTGPVQSAVTAGTGGFAFAFASCGRATAAPTWGRIAARNPDFFLSLGDTPYIDYAGTDRQVFRDAHRAFWRDRTGPVTATMPWVYVWDDHDFGTNNSNAGSGSKAAVQEVYREIQPHHPLAEATGGIHHAFTRGAVRFVVTDLRSYRTAGSMLGAAQLAWFKAELSAAARDPAIRLVVWANTVPWISGTDSDTWAGFPAERREIGDHILAEGLERRLAMISGDAHMLAADDGTNNVFNTRGVASFPVYQSGPINMTNTVKGGPYTTAPITASETQFSTMEVAPAQGGELAVTVRGYSDDAERYALSFVTASGRYQPVAPATVTLAPSTVAADAGTGTVVGTLSSDRPGATFALATASANFAISGTDLVVRAGASLAGGQSYALSVVATNEAGSSPARVVTVQAIAVAPPAPVFGTVRQVATVSPNLFSGGVSGTVGQAQFAQAPVAGNLLVLYVSADKTAKTFATPPGWSKADGHDGTGEVGGALFYRVATESETGAVPLSWTNGARSSHQMIEVAGPFEAGALLAEAASDKAEAQKSSVTLTTPAISAVPAVAVAFYSQDSKNKAPQNSLRQANGGFALLEPAAITYSSDGGEPLIVGATRVITQAGAASTTIGHTGAADGSIGFLAVFRQAGASAGTGGTPGYTIVSAPDGVSVSGTGDAMQVAVASGPHAAASPYPFSRAALDAAGLLVLATLPTTGGSTAGTTRIAVDPLVIGLASAGQIRQTRDWKRGGVSIGSTGPTHAVTADDVTLGLGIAFKAQNDMKALESSAQIIAAQSFEPLESTSLTHWTDGSDDTKFTQTGTRIDALRDKSGKGHAFVVSNATNRRPRRENGIITHAPGNDGSFYAPAWFLPDQDWTAFWVMRTTNVGVLLGIGGPTTADARFSAYISDNITARAHIRNAAAVEQLSRGTSSSPPGTAANFRDWTVAEVVNNSGAVKILSNGVVNYERTYIRTGAYDFTRLALFGYPNGSNNSYEALGADFSQFIHISTTDASARAQMRAWCAARRDELIAGGF